MRMLAWCLAVAAAVFAAGSCSGKEASVQVSFRMADGRTTPAVSAEIADEPGEQQLGLMYRKKMGENQGMLFVFPSEEQRSFWMKNTYLELDIIFISAAGEVVSVSERAVPLSQTSRPSVKPAKYVLEVLGGVSSRWGIKPGDKMIIEGQLPDPGSS